MEFRIERSALADAVAWAAKSLPARTPVPVLGGLMLEAEEGMLRVSGFDYEASARIEVPAQTSAPGRALVLGRRLLDICRVLPDTGVTCVLAGTRFTVEADGTRFGLSTLPTHEYPALPQLPDFRGAVDAEEFATAVAQVAIAVGRDDSLPVLTGVQLRLEGEELTLAASDRYRYAVRTLRWKPETQAASETAESDGWAEVVVPGRRLLELSRSLAKSGLVRVGLNDSGSGLIAFEADGMRTTLRLLEGRLPRYEKLFALEGAAIAVARREALADAVRRVAVVVEPNSPIQLDFSDRDGLLLQAGYEDDVANQRLFATLTGAEELSVAFNPTYLLEALNSFTTTHVRFALLGPGQRALLSGQSDPDIGVDGVSEDAPQDHRHLLMAVRQLG